MRTLYSCLVLIIGLLAAGALYAQTQWAGPNFVGQIDLQVKPTGGTIYRRLEDWLAGGTSGGSVLNYGAKCNGTANDTPAFVAASTSLASTGGLIEVPVGVCRLGASFSLPTNVGMIGTPGQSVIKALDSNISNPVLMAVTGSNNYISGVIFDGDSNGAIAGANNVVTVFGATRVIFDNITWQNTVGIGVIFSSNVSFSGVRNSTFRNVGNFSAPALANRHQAISFCCGTATNNIDNFATNNNFFQVGLDMISATSQYHILVEGNRGDTTAGNDGTKGAACVYGSTNHYLSIIGNTCYNASGNAYDTLSSVGLVISGNIGQFSGGSGLSTAFDTHAVISGNTMLDNWQSALLAPKAGISIFGTCSAITITGNILSDDQGSPTQQYGIQYFTTAPATGDCSNVIIDESNNMVNNVLSATSTNLVPTLGTGAGDCGTTPSVVGTDRIGRITVGAGANGGKCTMTFAMAWTNAPSCQVGNETSGNAVRPSANSVTSVAFTGTLTAGDALSYRCSGFY